MDTETDDEAVLDLPVVAVNRISPRDYAVRSGLLPSGWPRFPLSGLPISSIPGYVHALQRTIVARSYRQFQFTETIPRWNELSTDEKYGAVSTLWRSATTALHHQRSIRHPSSRVELIARKLFGCQPTGYVLDPPGKVVFCKLPMCIYCHARRVGSVYCDVVKAYRRRPSGSKVYMSLVQSDATPTSVYTRMKKLRPAGAVLFKWPIPGEDFASRRAKWRFRGVFVTDSLDKARGRAYQKITKPIHIYRKLASWLQYPVEWGRGDAIKAAARTALMFAEVAHRSQLYATFGACRDAYIPGVSWLDFVGWDPKPE